MGLKAIIIIFVAIILATALLTSIANTVDDAVNRDTSTNVSVDVSDSRCVGTSGQCDSFGAGAIGNETNSSQTITFNTEVGRTDTDCTLTNVVLRNISNDTIPAANFNLSYTTTDGDIFINLRTTNGTPLQSGSVSNLTYADYSFCPTGYVVDAISRTLTNLLPLLYVLGLLGIVVLFVMNRLNNKKE